MAVVVHSCSRWESQIQLIAIIEILPDVTQDLFQAYRQAVLVLAWRKSVEFRQIYARAPPGACCLGNPVEGFGIDIIEASDFRVRVADADSVDTNEPAFGLCQ